MVQQREFSLASDVPHRKYGGSFELQALSYDIAIPLGDFDAKHPLLRDNLQVLRDHIPDQSVDLIYLDPPFNSNASYNVLFKEKTGEESPAQIKAFTDTWE